jgi:hypothetical protein
VTGMIVIDRRAFVSWPLELSISPNSRVSGSDSGSSGGESELSYGFVTSESPKLTVFIPSRDEELSPVGFFLLTIAPISLVSCSSL